MPMKNRNAVISRRILSVKALIHILRYIDACNLLNYLKDTIEYVRIGERKILHYYREVSTKNIVDAFVRTNMGYLTHGKFKLLSNFYCLDIFQVGK